MKKVLCILLVLAFGFALIGCAAPTATPAAAPAVSGDQTVPEVQGNTATVVKADRADRDTLVVVLQGEPSTLDCQYSDDGNMYPIFRNTCDTIFRLDGQTLEPQLTFCESYELVDDTTWEFKMKSGIVFHDGDTLDSEDVVFSFECELGPELNSMLLYNFDTVDHCEAVDELTFRIITKEPDPLLPKRLLNLPIYSKSFTEAHTANDLTLTVNGTGPYKFVEWITGDYILLTANENYMASSPPSKTSNFASLRSG